MNAIGKVFPGSKHFLCRFHISKNVLANSRKLFRSKEKSAAFKKDWGALVFSSSIEDYTRNLESLDNDYKDHSRVLKYIGDTWLTL